MNRIAVVQELVKVAKELSAAGETYNDLYAEVRKVQEVAVFAGRMLKHYSDGNQEVVLKHLAFLSKRLIEVGKNMEELKSRISSKGVTVNLSPHNFAENLAKKVVDKAKESSTKVDWNGVRWNLLGLENRYVLLVSWDEHDNSGRQTDQLDYWSIMEVEGEKWKTPDNERVLMKEDFPHQDGEDKANQVMAKRLHLWLAKGYEPIR
jgi:hypothetical protein